MSLKKSLFVALVAAGAISMLADNSNAFFGLFRGGSHGSRGGWGSGGGWGSCGSHGGYGSGSHGSWGSHGGWGGSHGGYGGGHGSHGSHGGYYSAGYDDGGGYYARRGVVRRYAAATPVRETIVAKPATKTRLTLHVPADATVTLAGVTTKQTGEVRQFTTTKLANGQVWDDYTIVVAMERDGQTLREERTIKLTGGEAQELSIDVGSQQLAQR